MQKSTESSPDKKKLKSKKRLYYIIYLLRGEEREMGRGLINWAGSQAQIGGNLWHKSKLR